MSDLALQLIDTALKSGADLAEVYQSESFSRPVTFESNRLKQLETSESVGTALRIWRDGRPGLAVAYGATDPQQLVDKAIAISSLNNPESPNLAPAHQRSYPCMGTALSVDKLVDMGKQMIAQLQEACPEVLCNAEFDCEQDKILLINSRGLWCKYEDISLSYSLGAEWVRGDDFLGIYDGEYAHNVLHPDQVVRSILQRLDWAQHNATAQTGRVPVLFTSGAASMLWSTIAEALNGKQVLEGSSPWSQKLDQLVVSPEITLFQDPTADPFTFPVDDEGTPTRTLSLIYEGYLQEFYGDRTTSKKLGIEPTGNGFRPSLGRYPTPELMNLIIAPGPHTLLDMVAQLDNGIIVDQLLGGDADLSGEFSGNIDLGYQVRNGKIVGRVKDTMIAGNVYQALKNVIQLGGDRRWQGSCYTPSILVDTLSIIV